MLGSDQIFFILLHIYLVYTSTLEIFKDYAMVEKYHELLELVQSFEKDFIKFYERGNKTAGIRLRKHMQTLRLFAKSIRNDVQDIKKDLEEREK